MPSVHETAYPRLKSYPSRTNWRWSTRHQGRGLPCRRGHPKRNRRLGFLILLKSFQRLGYFVQLRDVPAAIVEHIAHTQGFLVMPEDWRL